MSKDHQNEEHLPQVGTDVHEEGIDLFALGIAVLSEWRISATAFVVISVVCILYIFSLKSQYVATATFLPQEGHAQSDPIAALFSSHDAGALYIGLLSSRSVQDATIDHIQLLQQLNTNSYETARAVLSSKSRFSEAGNSIITISIRDRDAQAAAKIANAYLDGLQESEDRMSLLQTTDTRSFFERQLQEQKDELAKAEDNLEKTQKQTGLIEPGTQTQMSLSSIASTRTQITTLQAQLASLLESETEQNPQVQRLRSQIAELQAEEATMEAGGSSPFGASLSAERVPQNNLDYARAEREVKYHEALVTSLANQFEAARLSEDFGRAAFRVVDRAVVPEHTSWPERKPLIYFSFIFAAFMGLVAAIAKLFYNRLKRDPKYRTNLIALRRVFGGE